MLEMKWYESHIGTENDAKRYINDFSWNIAWREKDSMWTVWSGDRVILVSDSKEVCEAFIYGMALAYSAIPQDYVEKFKKEHNYSGDKT